MTTEQLTRPPATFSPGEATAWSELTRNIGGAWVPVTTGDPCEHEMLYRTPDGWWVLRRLSWSGMTTLRSDACDLVTPGEARVWLEANGHDPALAGLA